MAEPLLNRVALVAGAGRGIACALGEAGATVYCTGRSVRGKCATEGRPETIDETAEMVTARGGKGIAVRCDHTKEADVKKLVARIQREQKGELDILVNDIGRRHAHRMGQKILGSLARQGFQNAGAGRALAHRHQQARGSADASTAAALSSKLPMATFSAIEVTCFTTW